MTKESENIPIVPIAEAIVFALKLLKGSPEGRNFRIAKKNLRIAKRMYKQFEKDFSEDGEIDPTEKALLSELRTNLVVRTISLGK